MPNVNVQVTELLLKAIRLACAETGQKQREFVVNALWKAVGGQGNGKPVKAQPEPEKAAPTVLAPVVGSKLIPGQKCSTCGAPVYESKNESTNATRWKCTGPRVHTMTPKDIAESRFNK